MKRNLVILFMIVFVGTLFTQTMPPTVTNRAKLARWVRTGTMTLTNKTLTSPTINAATFTGTITFSGSVSFTGAVTLSSTLIQTTTSAVVTGTVRSMTINQTQTGDGATILEALRVVINSAVQTGSWANAIVARIAYSGATGDAGGGLAAAVCAEVVLPAIASPAGSYFAADLEFDAQATYEGNTGSGFNVAYLRFGLYGNGTAIASFEDESYFMHVSTDFTDASGNMWYDNTLRIQIEATDWFIPLSSAEGGYTSAYNIDISGTSNLDNTDIDGTFTMDGTAFDVNSTATVTIDNTNTTNGVDLNTATSGSPIDIGNATSETTVGDNFTVTGDADVVGALTAGTIMFLADTTTVTDTFGGTITPAPPALVNGMIVIMIAASDNSGASTLAFNGLTSKDIKTQTGANPASADIDATGASILVYNNTHWVLINPATSTD